MEEKNCELLFEYLRSILYDDQVKTLKTEELDEPFRKLGMGLQYLEKAVTEMKQYTAALAKGNLSVEAPPRDNFLCQNLKDLHANLNHLTWHAKQVAKGDYSQTVSYLGEFSEAFNKMIGQLKEREDVQRREAEEEKEREEQLKAEAKQDILTGIGNRNYFMEHAAKLLESGEKLAFCYCDLDHLKYINDKYGHIEGDWYIRYFVDTIRQNIRENDVFARVGGDEFCIILPGCDRKLAVRKVEEMQHNFACDTTREYPKSFSCGILEIGQGHEKSDVTKIIEKADALMYRQKKEHKERYFMDLEEA